MLFLVIKSERVKLSSLGLGGAIPVLRYFLLIHFLFTTILLQLMLPRVQMKTDAFLRTGLPVCHFLYPQHLISSAIWMRQ